MFVDLKTSRRGDNMKKNITGKKIIFFVTILLITSSMPLTLSMINKAYTPASLNGYILFCPLDSNTTYLIDAAGNVRHTWPGSSVPNYSVYALENGSIVRTVDNINKGTTGVEIIDWNGTVVWRFEYYSTQYMLHHDIKPLPNGNILMISYDYKTLEEAIEAGLNPISGGVTPDKIIEVRPTGPTSGDIVWEWHVWDHLIQDFDPSKENYGVVADHPELIDINYGPGSWDWNHINSVDYNEEFDQILLSVHSFSEVWVIDHSTTTQEASGHTGGRSGKGGDLLYRWGNPAAYRAGTPSDQKFFGQHDASWIDPGCPGAGDILVFNNGFGRPEGRYSSVDEIVPPVNDTGHYFLAPGAAYGPDEQVWVYTAENPMSMYSILLSSAQRLPNGNTLLCSGSQGLFLEVTPEKQVVWRFTNLLPVPGVNDVFKIHRYPTDYPGVHEAINSNKKGFNAMNILLKEVFSYLLKDRMGVLHAPVGFEHQGTK